MAGSNEPSRPANPEEEDATRTYYLERYMSYPQLTASRLELAATCPGSFAHEHTHTTNSAAERGTAVHDYIAKLLENEWTPLPVDEETAALCRELNEQELYLLPETAEAGLLDGNHHRDYSRAPEGSIPGTADALAVEEDRVVVTDWKTGGHEPSRPADNYQLRFLGLAAARAYGLEEAVVQIGKIGEDGWLELHSTALDAEDLHQIESELKKTDRQLRSSREGEPVYRTGGHCRFCPAIASCPAVAGAAQSILDGPPEELTPATAADLWSKLQAVEAAAKRTHESLMEYVYARPIPTGEGKQLKVVETRRETIDSSVAFSVLRGYLPDEALAEAVSVTKSSLSGALDKEMQGEVLAILREQHAVNESYSESLREVRA